MNLQELFDEIDRQPSWEAHGRRAPHKPLTLLFALGQALHGRRIVSYAGAEARLRQLLDRFGPPRATQHPEQPVWRLRAYQGTPNSFWQLEGDLEGIEGAGGNPSVPLMRARIAFGLSESAWSALSANPTAIQTLALLLAEEVVPTTLQSALLEAVEIDAPAEPLVSADPQAAQIASLALVLRRRVSSTRIQRDPAFSRKVLDAYGRACAICSISPKLGADRFGLEAAHIRWARAGGPDEIPNGLCLCRMHHEALDWGALKVDESMKVRVSPRLEITAASNTMFARFDGHEIRLPQSAEHRPDERMLAWHWSEVYRP